LERSAFCGLSAIARRLVNFAPDVKSGSWTHRVDGSQPITENPCVGRLIGDFKFGEESKLSEKFKNMSKPRRSANAHAAAQAQAKLQQALALHQRGQLAQAQALYEQVLQMQPADFDALHLLGVIAIQTNNLERAVELIGRAIDVNPNNAMAYYNRGAALRDLKQYEAAIQSYDRAIALKPDYADAYNNRGSALGGLKQHEAAIQSFDKAIALKPDYAEAYNNRGIALKELAQYAAALQSYDKAIALTPDYVEAHNNRGVALKELKQYAAALQSYDQAIALKPDHADVYNNRGIALGDLKQHEAAIQSYGRALALKPDCEYLYGMRLHTRMQICDWRDVDDQLAQLAARIERNEKAVMPFAALALSGSLPLQCKVAEIWVQDECPASHALPKIGRRPEHDKIRIGYFSADFRNHPVSFLTAELFETHDRDRFELTAFSFGPDTNDAMRKRLMAAFDRFIDVRSMSDKDVATLARTLEIDIAVDLGGFTKDSRTSIFAMRAAPLQVSYIGYLGTMGAEYIDYLIADNTIIPEEYQKHYSERIVFLPSYQANDSKRRIADKAFTREELGLPQTGFVFCCFNNNYKITPGTFDGWMRILKQVDGSVLFLYAENERAAINLKKEAALRGVDAGRLIFGKRLPVPEYLARYRIADLFLDTLPYNAGTTASDALWAGLPVLTCVGEAFAGRVAASLLNAIHLPELVTSTQEAYEELAIALATNPERLRQIRQKLANNRLTAPLFDTPRFTRHIEAAYTEMYARYQAGLPPAHIFIKP
jgi:predicted O-linked N-acetylglucosamine transferase (SPINDLY family)